MAWTHEFPGATALNDRAERALRWPMGAVSPLWALFGAAATTGVGYWWLTQWTRAANIEALMLPVAHVEPPLSAAVEAAPTFDAAPVEPAPPAVEAEPPTAEAQLVLAAAPAPEPEPPEAVTPSEPAVSPAADDLTQLTGVGPKLAEALAASGVTRFVQIAAWTEEDLAKVDAALSLKGRAGRDAWVAQAKRLAGE